MPPLMSENLKKHVAKVSITNEIPSAISENSPLSEPLLQKLEIWKIFCCHNGYYKK